STEHRVDPSSVQYALHTVQYSHWLIPYYGLIALWLVGVLALAIGAARSAPVWAAALLGAGSVLVAIEGTVAANWYFIASSVVLLLGGAAVARAIAAMDDGAFAGA